VQARATAAPSSVSVGGSVTLRGSGAGGSGSYRYRWSQTSGPAVALSDGAAQNPTFTAPASPATLAFTLTVTDAADGSRTHSARLTIAVTGAVTRPAVPAVRSAVRASARARPSMVATEGGAVTLFGTATGGTGSDYRYRWRQTDSGGVPVALAGADSNTATFAAPSTAVTLEFSLTVTDAADSNLADTATVQLRVSLPADADGDDLIEIRDLAMLHNIRHDLAGTSYKTRADAEGNVFGCPLIAGCTGYELVADLDFDRDGDGRTWDADSFVLDVGDNAAPYFVIANDGKGGWQPLGDADSAFTATFEGNGHVIRNLAVRRNDIRLGLFGSAENARIRNLGLERALVYSTSLTGGTAGALWAGARAELRLLPAMLRGLLGGRRAIVALGGLVGDMNAGTIAASHAGVRVRTNSVMGARSDGIGGLVGYMDGGAIIASYATGDLSGSGRVGGLVGRMAGNGMVAASYASGDAMGEDEDDHIGGLVGEVSGTGTVTASYATGTVAGGGNDKVGRLNGAAGVNVAITQSYGFGTADGETIDSSGSPPASATAISLTRAAAGDEWGVALWDFGESLPPALFYADYDGDGGTDYCAQFAAADIVCNSLLAGQRIDSTPQIGTAAGDIRLAPGDAVNRITANVNLPATLDLGGNSINLQWSVHNDPETNLAQRVTVNGGMLQVNNTNRMRTRWITLRVENAANDAPLNDYRLRVLAE